MQILERERAKQPLGLSEVDFLANLILFASRIPGFDWRNSGTDDYRDYLAKTPRERIVQDIRNLLQGRPYGVVKTFVPQHRLEGLLPSFQQFTIWSLIGDMGKSEAKQILDQAFPALPRVTFKTNQPSVPEFSHAHTLVKLPPKVAPVPKNTLIWVGDKPNEGRVVTRL